MTTGIRKVAVVTGGSSGIGRAVALRLVADGWHVVAIARREPELARLVTEVRQGGGTADFLAADLSIPASLDGDGLVRLTRNFDHVALVYSAGVFGPIGPLDRVPLDEWMTAFGTNFLGAVQITHLLLPRMLAAGSGRLVYVSSAQALHDPDPLVTAYATSKVALNFFVASIATSLAGTGVVATALHPGDLKTPMWASIKSSAEALGEEAQELRAWASEIEKSGGADMSSAVEVVMRALHAPAEEVNGCFLLPTTGLFAHPTAAQI